MRNESKTLNHVPVSHLQDFFYLCVSSLPLLSRRSIKLLKICTNLDWGGAGGTSPANLAQALAALVFMVKGVSSLWAVASIVSTASSCCTLDVFPQKRAAVLRAAAQMSSYRV